MVRSPALELSENEPSFCFATPRYHRPRINGSRAVSFAACNPSKRPTMAGQPALRSRRAARSTPADLLMGPVAIM